MWVRLDRSGFESAPFPDYLPAGESHSKSSSPSGRQCGGNPRSRQYASTPSPRIICLNFGVRRNFSASGCQSMNMVDSSPTVSSSYTSKARKICDTSLSSIPVCVRRAQSCNLTKPADTAKSLLLLFFCCANTRTYTPSRTVGKASDSKDR